MAVTQVASSASTTSGSQTRLTPRNDSHATGGTLLNDEQKAHLAVTIGRPALTGEQQAFLDHGRYSFPKMGNRKGPSGGMSLRRKSIEFAADYDRIQLNNDSHINYLAVDVDGVGDTAQAQQADAISRLQACPVVPHAVVPTPHGAHGIWAIDGVPRESLAGQWAKDCQRNLCISVQGDPGYSAHTVANPLCARNKPIFLRDLALVYRLEDIKSLLGDRWVNQSPFATQLPPGDGRNTRLFTEANRLRTKLTHEELREHLHKVNAEEIHPPLPNGEVDAIAKSAQRKRAKREYQARLGRKGGLAQSAAQKRALVENRDGWNRERSERAGERIDRVIAYLETGVPLTTIIEIEDVHRSTIFRDLAYLKKAGLLPKTNGRGSVAH